MKTHNKNNPTLFHLKELSNHLGLDEDETVKILNEAKKLGYIKFNGIIGEIKSQYYITEIGILEVKNNLKNRFNTFVEHPIFKGLALLITTIYGLYEIIIIFTGK
jgi:hypothetical protein